jgi:hypothetical protein
VALAPGKVRPLALPQSTELHALDVRSAELSWRLTSIVRPPKQTSPATAEMPLTTPREGAMTEREAIVRISKHQ